MHEQALRVLKYWEHVERYSAPIAEDEGERSVDMTVSHIVDKNVPWPSKADSDRSVRHFVRYGITNLDACDKILVRRWSPLAKDPEDSHAEGDRYTFAGVFAVSDQGSAEKGSLVVSRFLHELAAALDTTDISFSEYADALETEFKARLKARSKPLAIAAALADRAFLVLQLPAHIRAAMTCIVVTRSKPIVQNKPTRKVRDSKVFSSVYPDLLRELRSDVEDGVIIGAAWDLLTMPPVASDFDAAEDAVVLETLRTERYPSARWPSDFSLSPQQQVAVNELFARLENGGVFSINGPPGTGKTTLLMDVVAEIIARRAEILRRYDDPLTAFTPVGGGGAQFMIDHALHDFLIAVASSNNGAVANLTLELPKREKIGKRYGDRLSYLSGLAQNLMAQHRVMSSAWGSISVPLGNRQNRDRCAASIAEALEGAALFENCDVDDWQVARDEYAAASAKVEEIKAAHVRLNELLLAADGLRSIHSRVGTVPGATVPTLRSSTHAGALAVFERPDRTQASDAVLARATEQIDEVVEELGIVVTQSAFVNAEPHARAEMLVGTSAALERARAELFIAAMKLHQSFVYHAWERIGPNLAAWIELNSGKGSGQLASIAGHLWGTFSLLVPVVSSTFSSFASTFGRFDRGAIPWLIVDEAGQACSHHAIDAVSRAKRAIVVGDPFQIEPICTISTAVDNALAAKLGVPPAFRCKSTSLQTLADRINPFGANRNGKWIGAPLKVHRRCAEPMFSIANGLAYDESMVLGHETTEREARLAIRRPMFGPSAWINVAGISEMPNDFYVPEEGTLARQIVSSYIKFQLSERGEPTLPDLFLISPFRKVAIGLKQRLLDDAPEVFGDLAPALVEEWIDRSVGTVHSFQGKEAETVLLILGAKRLSSIQWALETPNIMNVAVTRARRRLYIIGNRANWLQDQRRDRWMLGTNDRWLIEADAARAMFSSQPRKPVLRVV
ncbi:MULTISPECIES: DEAD/DEAH box helicase [Rhizobium]|uniref:DNA2/NAM7 helicase-like C-terminal domain-containing protein n=1 Tax=Rhizobium favelukesii TaxID=348824 RepID=W6RNV7_9HYPH|nr:MULTISPECIES: ATP-binding protein [Rhizobium]MCS0457905.1 ATP-binding protein [Rhizobium favelukesii]UFS78960.1 ATP-binding protein [Rhizobium sp. T136]CDM62419.1 hypothetical protein LPU83_pLPU83d_1049 [Rhizobium favelukesii]